MQFYISGHFVIVDGPILAPFGMWDNLRAKSLYLTPP